MSLTDLFHQCAVVEFLVKEGNLKAGFTTLIQRPNNKAK